ncbi:MAG: hypothetical protein HYY31_02760 [Chloroflexi bacterium]|nr:hypothetical protein [Chloroflexota bacterium]
MRQVRSRVTATQQPRGVDVGCKHYWVIDSPTGPVSKGVCKLCGEKREFKNYLDMTPYWEDNLTLDQVSTGARFRTQVSIPEVAQNPEE